MHFSIFLLLFGFCYVQGKNNVKSLTESMGQEVIELGSPIKELPPGLEEEPSAEVDDDEKTTITSAQPVTRRETKKTTTISTILPEEKTTVDGRRVNDAISPDEEERRIEKELSEIYKDTDYKADSDKELLKEPVAALKGGKNKPVGRAKTNFKFQPNVNDRADVERFRTSVDEISCDKRVTHFNTQLSDQEATSASGCFATNIIAMSLALVWTLVCQ